jgi:homoserine dehydrogenase
MSDSLKVGIAGLGTVGGGVATLLTRHHNLIAARAGKTVDIAAVSARDKARDRGVDLSRATWHDDALDMVDDPNVDLIVEAIGGADGIAKDLCVKALEARKPVVTANKALMAEHGGMLAILADRMGVALAYEAAVAGGIPIIKGVREGLSANVIDGVYGILNGTCNYILSEMRTSGRDFDDVLVEAQDKGYAEADPSFDIDGVDAAHKLAILAALAFNGTVSFDDVYVEGIRRITARDIAYAEELGFRVKLLGIARRRLEGVALRVHPCLVPQDAPIASVEGVYNAVIAQGDFVDQIMMVGPGAGAGPTASAVVADIARGFEVPVLGTPVNGLAPLTAVPIAHRGGPYYLRLMVSDQPGVIATIAALMRDNDISVESLLQRGRSDTDAVPVVIVTHETNEAAMQKVIDALDREEAVLEPPHVIRIETLIH